MSERVKEKDELMFRFSQWISPLVRMAEHPEQFPPDERVRVLARCAAEQNSLIDSLRKYMTGGEPGHHYSTHYKQVRNQLASLMSLSEHVNTIHEQQFFHQIKVTVPA